MLSLLRHYIFHYIFDNVWSVFLEVSIAQSDKPRGFLRKTVNFLAAKCVDFLLYTLLMLIFLLDAAL